ncbi:SprT-like domain-containing protein [Vibrio parahaemolyticus]|nr:SprT-like domain-containing protein [Vibrio parahaemolyticus]
MSIPTTEVYAELQQAFEHFNATLFGGELPPCLITLQRERRTFGYFSRNRFVQRDSREQVDEIAMNPAYFAIRSIAETLSTLAHEMAHQWQFHHGKPGRRGYHNKEWAAKMDEIGLTPSNTGEPGGKRVGEKMSHYIAEGGPFDLACQELLTQRFTLSWLDRFPPERPKPKPAKLGGDEDDEGGGDDLDELGGLVELPPEGPTNKSNRNKYRCPNCQAQVWGKPGLVVLCGAAGCDGVTFEVAE